MDPLFKVVTLAATPNPQKLMWLAMHQDYSEHMVAEEELPTDEYDERWYGKSVIKHLLAGGRGHFGPLEHPSISLNFGYFPHSTMQQMRTHRTGITFDVQSFRYTGKRMVDLIQKYEGSIPYDEIEKVIYIRPVGIYKDRQGDPYEFTYGLRQEHLERCIDRIDEYYSDHHLHGLSEEHARGMLPFDYRQHWVMSANPRTLMHLLDMRFKKDAQLECQWLCELMFQAFDAWCPEIAQWYKENRLNKVKLAP